MSWKPLVQKSSPNTEICGDGGNPQVSFLEMENGKAQHRSKPNMSSQTLGLFRKYLLEKAHQHMNANDKVTSKRMVRSHTPQKPLRPHTLQDGTGLPRRLSLLEQEILPIMRSSPVSTASNGSPKAQLTIFYSGSINVYDNVPIDKAQAIMLLAGASSTPKTKSPRSSPKPQSPTAPSTPPALPHCSSLPSSSKLQAELPIARKHSLQRFLEKRRDRIMSKAPYSSQTTMRDAVDAKTSGCSKPIAAFSPSPFTSSPCSLVNFDIPENYI